MHKAEVFLIIIITVIMLMLICQTISVRIRIRPTTTVSVEYFPIKILLYNFGKMKIKKRKLAKQTKRLLFFLPPILKSFNFLLARAKVKFFQFSFFDPSSSEPHSYYLSQELASLSKTYIYSLLYAVTKSNYELNSEFLSENENTANFDFELTTRLYNVFLALIVLIFYSIKKRGKKKIV